MCEKTDNMEDIVITEKDLQSGNIWDFYNEMSIGDTVKNETNMSVFEVCKRVPNGWVLYYGCDVGIGGVFIPLNKQHEK